MSFLSASFFIRGKEQKREGTEHFGTFFESLLYL